LVNIIDMMSEGLMLIDQVAQMTGYKVGTVYQLVCQRRIPFIKLSTKALRFDRAEIERWIESHREGADKAGIIPGRIAGSGGEKRR